ncbi:MAG: hypothetical protein WKG07_41105 [Hymenobacter sp.]
MTFLNPAAPVLNQPNKLTPADFAQGWVQEQGLYYPSAWDAHYQPVIASHDPGEPGPERCHPGRALRQGAVYLYRLSLFRAADGRAGPFRVLAGGVGK